MCETVLKWHTLSDASCCVEVVYGFSISSFGENGTWMSVWKNSLCMNVWMKYIKFTIQAFVDLKESCERNGVRGE